MQTGQGSAAMSGSHSEPGWLSLGISGPLLGAGTDHMLGRSLSVWGPTLGQVDMQVPYGSMHQPEGRGREAVKLGQEQHPFLWPEPLCSQSQTG